MNAHAPPSGRQQAALLLAVLLICALPLSKNQPDPDFWGHVQYGRDALAGGLPATATYTYNAQGRPWINHEHLSEWLLAVGIDALGPSWLLCIKCLAGVLFIGALLRHAQQRGVSQPAAVATVLLVAINLMHFWLLRPQLMSYLCFAALVMLLDRRPAGRRDAASGRTLADDDVPSGRALWLLPPLFLLWANAHGGFVAGYAVLAVTLLGRQLEAMVAGRAAAGRRAALLAGLMAACGLATLGNPHGWRLHAWLAASLGTPRPEIVEWRAPELASIAWLPWWVLVAVAVAAVAASNRRRDWTQLAVLVLVLWQAVEHRRHIPFFAILFGFWLVTHVDGLLARLVAATHSARRRADHRLGRAFLLAVAGVCLLAAATLARQLAVMPVLRCRYPVSAFQYMADQNLNGRLVLRFMWAQYAIAALGRSDGQPGGVQVAFDGRFRTCYPQTVVDMYFDYALGDDPAEPRQRSPQSGPIDDDRILRHGDPDLALLDRNQMQTVRVLRRHRDRWVLLYQDGLAQLWGRRDKYDRPDSPHYLPPSRRRIGNELQTGFAPWPALPQRTGRAPHATQLTAAGTTAGDPFLATPSSRRNTP